MRREGELTSHRTAPASPGAKGVAGIVEGPAAMKAHDHYGALVESSDDGLVAKDLDGVIVSWNPAAERIFGYSVAEMVGCSIRRLLPEERQKEEDDILACVRNGERVDRFVTKRLHKCGKLIDVSVTISPMRDGTGKIVGASKIVRDATEWLATQRRIQESEERYQLLANNMPQLAWIAEANGDIGWYNQRWLDYTGIDPESMGDRIWSTVHHPDHLERVEARFLHSRKSGDVWEDIFPLRRHDGTYRWFLSRAEPIRDEQGKITQWFGTNTDITEQREQAEQIKLLLAEVNHRARNMLAIVQAMARRSAGDGTIEGFVQQFERRIASLALNQDILVNCNWGEVPMAELTKRQLAFVDTLSSRIDAAGPNISVTPKAAEIIGMALHELAMNALKHGSLSVPHGRVSIRWDFASDSRTLQVEWRETGGPPVDVPKRKGFGTQLIDWVPRHGLNAEVSLDYDRSGLTWSLISQSAISGLPSSPFSESLHYPPLSHGG
jgi:PAS domain S-box-containing protein